MKYLLIILIVLIILILNLPEKNRNFSKTSASGRDDSSDAPTQKGNMVQKAFIHGKNRH